MPRGLGSDQSRSTCCWLPDLGVEDRKATGPLVSGNPWWIRPPWERTIRLDIEDGRRNAPY